MFLMEEALQGKTVSKGAMFRCDQLKITLKDQVLIFGEIYTSVCL